MKPLLFLPLLLWATVSSVSGLDTVFLEPVQPISPELKAQGGVSTANAEGFDALFANPAAFSVSKADISILRLETTAHMPLSGLNRILDSRNSWGSISPTAMGPGDILGVVSSLIATSPIGQEFSTGSSWVGNNLGVGLVFQGRGTVKGKSLLDATTSIDVTSMGVIGMAWPFDVGLGTLRLGGAIRPMQRTISDLPATELLKNFGGLGSLKVKSGFGMGMDLGVRWDYLGFQTGLVLRDVSGTILNLKEFTINDWSKGLGFPAGGDASGSTIYRIPTVIGVGSSWTPDVGSLASLFQPKLSLDLQIPLKDEFTQPSFWTWTHVGAEAKLLKFFSLRGGLNEGYLTFGLGARISIVELNFAIFADELGRYSGVNRRSGLSMEWAFRL